MLRYSADAASERREPRRSPFQVRAAEAPSSGRPQHHRRRVPRRRPRGPRDAPDATRVPASRRQARGPKPARAGLEGALRAQVGGKSSSGGGGAELTSRGGTAAMLKGARSSAPTRKTKTPPAPPGGLAGQHCLPWVVTPTPAEPRAERRRGRPGRALAARAVRGRRSTMRATRRRSQAGGPGGALTVTSGKERQGCGPPPGLGRVGRARPP
jgi:hypothetical protein